MAIERRYMVIQGETICLEDPKEGSDAVKTMRSRLREVDLSIMKGIMTPELVTERNDIQEILLAVNTL